MPYSNALASSVSFWLLSSNTFYFSFLSFIKVWSISSSLFLIMLARMCGSIDLTSPSSPSYSLRSRAVCINSARV